MVKESAQPGEMARKANYEGENLTATLPKKFHEKISASVDR